MNVATKSGLNKAIRDQGWGMLRHLLEYKQCWQGDAVLAVNPRFTSQTCPECGHVTAYRTYVTPCLPCYYKVYGL